MGYSIQSAALLLLLAAAVSEALSSPKDYRQKWNLTRQDVVIAMPVDKNHLTLAKGSRVWRKGVRALIASNEQPSNIQIEEGRRYNETWTWWPDDVPQRSMYVGDTRAAIVPFLAHKQLGDTYKWLLYGDDDTVWFMDGVLDFLSNLDPDMPYFISDHLWWSTVPGRASHPNKEAPRCLPCNFPDHHLDHTKAPFRAPKGCPCTPKLLCDTDQRGIFNDFCDIPRAPVATYSMHGGAGGIMSIGLMRAVSLQFMEMCIKSLYSTGGDAFITICLWQAGYAVTDPGFSFYHPEVQMFDPGPEDRMGIMLKLVRALDSNRCDIACKNVLDHMLTIHVRSRVFSTMDDAAQFVKAIVILYDVYVDAKHQHVLQEQARVLAEATAKAAAKAKDDAAKADAAQKKAQAAKDRAAQAAGQSSNKVQAENALEVANKAVAAARKRASETKSAANRAASAAAALEAKAALERVDVLAASDTAEIETEAVTAGALATSTAQVESLVKAGALAGGAAGKLAGVRAGQGADLAEDGMRVRMQASDVAKAGLGLLDPVSSIQQGSQSNGVTSGRADVLDGLGLLHATQSATAHKRHLLAEARHFLEGALERRGVSLHTQTQAKQ